MASATHNMTFSSNGDVVSRQAVITQNGLERRDVVVPATTGEGEELTPGVVEIELDITAANIKSITIIPPSTKAVDIETTTPDPETPGDTFELAAGDVIFWNEKMKGVTCPITEDIAKITLTNNDSSTAFTVPVRILWDATIPP